MKVWFLTSILLAAGALAGCADNPTEGTGDDVGANPVVTTSPTGEPTITPTRTATPTPQQTGTITFRQAGSSTVLPVAQAWAEEYPKVNPRARFTVAGGGTGAGFQQFCRGEIDIADASRPIRATETSACGNSSITPYEVQVGVDALAVVVSKSNTFVNNLSVAELHRIWTANTSLQANKWSDLRPEWPNQDIIRYGPGTDSGTFDYFIEVIIHPKDGTTSRGRSDYTPSEDDNVLVRGVQASQYAVGYFGLAYVHENEDRIRAVPIDELKGGGAVHPTVQNAEQNKYKPLARPIFMYVNGKPTGVMRDYFLWGLGDEGQELVEEIGYVKVPAPKRAEILANLSS